MYTENDQLESLSEDCTVRRYMSMTKFLSIIQSNQIFFPSLDLLASGDKFEGLFNLIDHPLPHFSQVKNDFQRNYRKHCFVNCWNCDVVESYALWKIYLDNNSDGVAIETRVSNLKNCFKSFPEDVLIGKISYDSNFNFGSRLFAATTKRSQFSYEKEVRVIYEKIPLDENGNPEVKIPPLQSGYYIPIDLQVLFGKVIVSPFSSSWFHDLVRGIMNKYGYTHIEVDKSTLSANPF
jgi:hypothetical protein